MEVQEEIVAEIEGYQKVIDGARAVVENYRPQVVVDPSGWWSALEKYAQSILERAKFVILIQQLWFHLCQWLT